MILHTFLHSCLVRRHIYTHCLSNIIFVLSKLTYFSKNFYSSPFFSHIISISAINLKDYSQTHKKHNRINTHKALRRDKKNISKLLSTDFRKTYLPCFTPSTSISFFFLFQNDLFLTGCFVLGISIAAARTHIIIIYFNQSFAPEPSQTLSTNDGNKKKKKKS